MLKLVVNTDLGGGDAACGVLVVAAFSIRMIAFLAFKFIYCNFKNAYL
jgi:hypothetical protein